MYGTIRKVVSFLDKRERIGAVLLVAGLLFGAALETIGVAAIPAFVTTLSDPAAVRSEPRVAPLFDRLGISTDASAVQTVGLFVLGVYVLKSLAVLALAEATSRFVLGRQVALARRLFASYLARPYLFHLSHNSTELIRNVAHSAMGVGMWALHPMLRAASELLTLTAIVLLLLAIEPLSSMAALAMLALPSLAFMGMVRGRAATLGEAEHRERESMLRTLSEGLHGIQLTRVSGVEDHFYDRFAASSRAFADSATRRLVLWELPRPVLETVAVAGLLAIALLLLSMGRTLESLVPTLTLLAVAAARLIPSFTRILTALSWLRFAKSSVDTVHEDLMHDEREPWDPPLLERLGPICLEHVGFDYPGSEAGAIHDVSLRIEPGEAVGVVGPTGSGKSTLIGLILGLLQPVSGRVTIGGVDLKGRERAWQRRVGFVPQEIFLLDTTIRRNIAFGVPDDQVDEKAIWRAVDAAGVREFVEKLPAGLDTVVGERGMRLSGGQRQRVVVARALYRDPPVVVMDEATSALDAETERVVMQAIDELKGERTLIIVAHRPSTVAGCDRVFRLEAGQQR